MCDRVPPMRVLVAVEPAGFRSGIDDLAQLWREELRSNPFEGAVFVFRNRKAKMIRIPCSTAGDPGFATRQRSGECAWQC